MFESRAPRLVQSQSWLLLAQMAQRSRIRLSSHPLCFFAPLLRLASASLPSAPASVSTLIHCGVRIEVARRLHWWLLRLLHFRLFSLQRVPLRRVSHRTAGRRIRRGRAQFRGTPRRCHRSTGSSSASCSRCPAGRDAARSIVATPPVHLLNCRRQPSRCCPRQLSSRRAFGVVCAMKKLAKAPSSRSLPRADGIFSKMRRLRSHTLPSRLTQVAAAKRVAIAVSACTMLGRVCGRERFSLLRS